MLLACARATSTQRLTCAACRAGLAPPRELVPDAVALAVGLGAVVMVRVGAGVLVRVTDADGRVVAVALTGAGGLAGAFAVVPVTVEVGVSVRVGTGGAVALGAAGCVADVDDELAVGLAPALLPSPLFPAGSEAVPVVVLVVMVGAGLVVAGVAAGVVGAGVGVCDVGVGEGDGFGEAAGNCTGSHDFAFDVVAALATEPPAATARLTPEPAVSRTLPAISVTVAGRACAKRMKRPTSAAGYCFRTAHPVRSGFMRSGRSARRDIYLFKIKHPRGRYQLSCPLATGATPVALIKPGPRCRTASVW
jgi:hypothetical protein